jgi:hypothetical protein
LSGVKCQNDDIVESIDYSPSPSLFLSLCKHISNMVDYNN